MAKEMADEDGDGEYGRYPDDPRDPGFRRVPVRWATLFLPHTLGRGISGTRGFGLILPNGKRRESLANPYVWWCDKCGVCPTLWDHWLTCSGHPVFYPAEYIMVNLDWEAAVAAGI